MAATAVLAALLVQLLLVEAGRTRWTCGPDRSGWQRIWPNRRGQAVDAVALLGALRAELLAGRPPPAALSAALLEHVDSGQFERTIGALRLGGDVADALRRESDDSSLAGLSALWSVSESTGASLADGVARLADSERARLAARRELRAELASARATGQVLALLPIAGLALGSMLGADPIGWLTGSPVGWVDLAIATGLIVLGWRWTKSILTSVERRT